MKQLRVGFALCGSFCTLSKAIAEMRELKARGRGYSSDNV